MTHESDDRVPFQAHVDLLQSFLAHRDAIVEKIQDVLNAQRKPIQYLQDRAGLSRQFEDCFFTLAAVDDDRSRLRGRLEEAHWASGFRPRRTSQVHNDLIHPAEMMMRAFFCWQQTRWPGRNGRLRYAHTLFNVYLLRCLELLSMRLWDTGPDGAGERLAQIQALLDALWSGSPPDQPAFVRDARWLIPLAQSPTTDELDGYFDVAERVAESLSPADRLEVRKAGVRMIGGHLTSQIRHYCIEDRVSIDDESVVRRTRTSNALDFALLIQSLASLLEAYEQARIRGDNRERLDLAGAICQGISPDPELFLNRVDLLGAYSMIEHLFIATNGDGNVAYTPAGQRHVGSLRDYAERIGRQAKYLYEDCSHFRPVDGGFSPYGAIYGTPSHLTEHMALKALQREAVTRFGLEDVFEDGGPDKLAWVDGWRQLPHIDRALQRLHEYPRQFAEDIFDRIEQELRRLAGESEANDLAQTGRLMIPTDPARPADSPVSSIPDLPVRYIGSSDAEIVAAHEAGPYDQAQLLRDRQEGHFVLSYETAGGWVAIKKNMLTEVLGAGHDAKVVGLPVRAAGVLRLMCPGIAVTERVPQDSQASVPPSMLNA